ncbi:MAG: hypothetical protein J6S21_02955, partial [Victivallales bacterium]|nr:hypothetical protein [Victivallales bacterium]
MIDITRLISERPFLVRLFNGTAAKLQERVNSDGFCHTSFGEQGGVRCYGDSHYPRDAAEAAKALALLGDHELALNVLSFHFRHTPPEQRYLPHVLLPDGSIKHNNIQTDTLAHSAMALASCAEAAARTPVPPEKDSRILRLYGECLRFADWLWEDHFHTDYSLLDSGNFNEQGFHGSKEALL